MDGSWDVYIARLRDGPALIQVDSALIARAPISTHPTVVACNMKDLSVGDNKLPTQASIGKIMLFETRTRALIQNAQSNIYVGRASYGDITTFAFYSADGDALIQMLEGSNELKTSLQFRCHTKWDSEWSFYRTVLYPRPIDRNRIENAKVLKLLNSQGDDGATRRKVDHFAYFRDSTASAAFIQVVEKDGYKIERRATSPDEKGSWVVVFSKGQFPAAMDPVTWALEKQAQEFKGEYDGWESPTVKGP